ncbi:hypothetical protein ASD59_10510 [Brevundimonas sp. Root608]|nr:hypothetical protein ASD59_10510 [Brevundimonas sp. Root608]
MMTTAMRAAIRPYSMAVAPDSSDRNCETNLVIAASRDWSIAVGGAPGADGTVRDLTRIG